MRGILPGGGITIFQVLLSSKSSFKIFASKLVFVHLICDVLFHLFTYIGYLGFFLKNFLN